MLKLTPQQVAQVAQLSDQTLRHWRQVLPPLAGLNGYTPCFSPGDALALLVVRHLVKVIGISVGARASASNELFDLCRNTSWPHLADQRLLIQVEHGSVHLLSSDLELDEPTILIRCASLPSSFRVLGRAVSRPWLSFRSSFQRPSFRGRPKRQTHE